MNIQKLILTKKICVKENEKEISSLPKTIKILTSILKISIPAAIETLLIGIIGLIDTMMVGKCGVEALAGVSICQQPVFITLAVAMGLNVGITAIISRKKGENDSKGACKTMRDAVILSAGAGLFFSILGILFAKPFLLLAGAEEDSLSFAITYFRSVSTALIFNYVRLAICAGLRAEGKTKITLVVNILANLCNLFLNYLLINGNLGFPKLGVLGAGIATAISNFIAFVICFILICVRKGFLHIRVKNEKLLEKNSIDTIIKFSLPAFIEQLFMRIGFFLIAMIVNNLGTYVVAMNAIISGCISLAFNVTDGFSVGASSLVGKSLGESKKVLAFAYARLSQITSFLLGLVMIGIILTARKEVCLLFTDDLEVIEGAKDTLKLAVFVVLPQSMQWVTTGALRGAGDVKFTARTSMLSVAIIRPLFAYLMCYPLGLGLLGSWIGMFIDQTLRFIINNNRLESMKWAKIKV